MIDRVYVKLHRGGDAGGEQVSRVEPPEFVRPYYEDILRRGEDLSLDPREQFPYSTVVPYSPETEAALAGITERALGGSPLVNAAQAQQLGTIEGAYLDPFANPAYQSVIDAVTADVLPSAYRSYAGGGQHWGSPVESEAVARGLSRGLAPFAFGHYGQERGLQQAAAAGAPALAETDYRDLEALLGVGGAREQDAQRRLQEAIDRFHYPQEEPRIRLGEYANLIFGATPQFDARQQQIAQGGSPAAGALGGALSGAAAGTAIAPGWGTLAGAALGGVGGAPK
jgi:hypothetical protein